MLYYRKKWRLVQGYHTYNKDSGVKLAFFDLMTSCIYRNKCMEGAHLAISHSVAYTIVVFSWYIDR